MKQKSTLLMKQWLVLLSAYFGFALTSNAENVEIDGLYYELNTTDRTATLTYEKTTTANYSSLPPEVVIPSTVQYNNVRFTVTTISNSAFANCSSLESISIPSSVTRIGTTTTTASSLPFYNCTSLKSIIFEDGSEPLSLSAYYNHGATGGKGAFSYCPLEEVYIGRNITYPNYGSSFDSYPSYYGYSAFYNQAKLTKITIGNLVTNLPDYIFYQNTALKQVISNNSVISVIPNHAFDGCKVLDSAIIFNFASKVGNYAFNGCTALERINIPNAVEIGNYAFYNCSSLNNATATNLNTIGEYAFYNTTSLKEFTFSASLQSIGNYAFRGTGIINVLIPSGVITIGNNSFSSSLTENVSIGDNNIDLGTSIFYNCARLTTVSIGDGLITIPEQTFSDCTSLKDVIIGNSIATISNSAFANCSSLESISIPSSVTRIGTTTTTASSLPFYNCTSLKSIIFEDGSEPLSLSAYYNHGATGGKGAFSYCPLEEVYIGRNITYPNYGSSFDSYPSYYGYSAFYNQAKLTKVTIGNLVTDIPPYLFYQNSAVTLLTLPHVKTIGKSAFESCSKLTTLNLGDAIETVGDRAFYNDGNITKLTFPNTTKSIGYYAFYQNTSVTEVTVGTGLESIGDGAFYGDKSFTALILPDKFKTMGESAFEGCAKLTVAKLGESLTGVPAKAFKNCSSLSEMIIPATVLSIGDQAFYNDSGLATITMKEGLKTIGNEVFWNNSGVMSFTIPGTVTSMGSNCFYGCTRVMYLTFSDGEENLKITNTGGRSSKIDAVTTSTSYRNRLYDYFYDCPIRFLTLGRNLTYSYSDSSSLYDPDKKTNVTRASAPFFNAADLRSVTIGPKVTFLYHHLFDNCKNLSIVSMNDALETVYTYAFNDCDALPQIGFPASLITIDKYAFSNCDLLKSTTYQDATDHTLSINASAFRNCIVLEEVIFPGQLKYLGESAYQDCATLNSTIFNNSTIENNNLEINDYCFSNCTALHTVKFPNHLYKIYNYVYEKCPSLNTLSFPGNLVSIGNYVFKNTAFLTDIRFEDSAKAVTLGYGAALNSTSTTDSASKPLFGNSNLEKLYLGRNIEYNAISTYGYSPFYNQTFLTDVKFSQAGTVTYCKDYLLYYVTVCEELILPESLTDIGSYTFAQMQKLQGITIPNKVTTMGTYAFAYDTDLQYANLSTACAWLKEGVFSGCSALEAITIPPVVTKMDTKLFANCSSLASVRFEGNTELIEIGYGASQTNYGLFRDCPVETLYLDRWLSYNTDQPSRSPFYSIAELKNLTLGANVQVIDKYMFSYCTGLEEVVLPDNITSVGLWGFRGCSSLKNVRFSQKLSQISDYGFSECTSLDNVVFPASLTSVADNSFSHCTSLRKLDLGTSLLIIGPSAFMYDTALEAIEIPETLYGLGVEAFKGCTALPNVKIRSISSVGARAFQDCTGLKWVSLSDKTTSLGEDSFAGCTGIEYVKSYATFPPEGLVNFAENVPANGILYVPSASIMYYRYSPTWENWFDIRPLTEDVTVESITLNKNELSLQVSDCEQLIATVDNDDAADKRILWTTSDDKIVSVDTSGYVTALEVGEAIVTAIAADGAGAKAECHVTVLPTLVENIAINSPVTTLKKGRTLVLSATVMPVTATNKNIKWTSSDNAVAEVDDNGEVRAISVGTVKIRATAQDASSKYGEFELTVTPPVLGDSNDNDEVTVTDAVNTANYAVGKPVENFCEEAADVNGDKRITIADASGTITIILNQKPSFTTESKIRAMEIDADSYQGDELVIGDFSTVRGKKVNIPVTLGNTVDYVALQADILLPSGMRIENIEAGNRANTFHKLVTKNIADGIVRVILFDIENRAFADNDESIFSLNVITDAGCCEDIVLFNILASDIQANEYKLTAKGGQFIGTTGVDEARIDSIIIKSTPETVEIHNAQGQRVLIYTLDGMTVADFIAQSDFENLKMQQGIYVVAAGDRIAKIIVR